MKKIVLVAIMIIFTSAVSVSQLSVGEQDIPDGCKLFQNFPNTFDGEITIKFYLNEDCSIKLFVSNITTGKRIELAEGHISAGEHGIIFKNPKSDRGEYVCTLEVFSHVNNCMIYTSQIVMVQK